MRRTVKRRSKRITRNVRKRKESKRSNMIHKRMKSRIGRKSRKRRKGRKRRPSYIKSNLRKKRSVKTRSHNVKLIRGGGAGSSVMAAPAPAPAPEPSEWLWNGVTKRVKREDWDNFIDDISTNTGDEIVRGAVLKELADDYEIRVYGYNYGPGTPPAQLGIMSIYKFVINADSADGNHIFEDRLIELINR